MFVRIMAVVRKVAARFVNPEPLLNSPWLPPRLGGLSANGLQALRST
jgi:hypothetical protein